jgi:predicted HTH transcriptional regulator
MKDSLTDYDREFEEIVGNLADTVHDMSDPVAIATMLYTIAEERKNGNLVIRDINAKFDNILERLQGISMRLDELDSRLDTPLGEGAKFEISDRDREILNYVTNNKRVCADDLQENFQYRGRNAASARLSKLFRENLLEKVYVGRKVYYQRRIPD